MEQVGHKPFDFFAYSPCSLIFRTSVERLVQVHVASRIFENKPLVVVQDFFEPRITETGLVNV